MYLLNGSTKAYEFKQSPFSSIILIIFIATIAICQITIEVKRLVHNWQQDKAIQSGDKTMLSHLHQQRKFYLHFNSSFNVWVAQYAMIVSYAFTTLTLQILWLFFICFGLTRLSYFIVAITALNQIEEATQRFHSHPLIELRAETLPHEVKLAWQDNATTTTTKTKAKSNDERLYQSSKAQAFKVARSILVFGAFPAMILVFLNNSFVNSEKYRPHGSTIFLLALYGIIYPLIIVCNSKKIRQFIVGMLIK